MVEHHRDGQSLLVLYAKAIDPCYVACPRMVPKDEGLFEKASLKNADAGFR